jgi:hypothetical protein
MRAASARREAVHGTTLLCAISWRGMLGAGAEGRSDEPCPGPDDRQVRALVGDGGTSSGGSITLRGGSVAKLVPCEQKTWRDSLQTDADGFVSRLILACCND